MIVAPPEPPVFVQEDPQSLYRSAVADRLAGRPAEAVAKLERVLAARPDDIDARLNLGLALLALDRLDEAEAALRRVVDQTPAYVDAWVGLARVEQRRGNLVEARTLAEEAGRLEPGHPDVVALRRVLAPAPIWRVDVSVARSTLSGDLPDWTEARLSVTRQLDNGWSTGLALEATERFEQSDVYLEARLDKRFGAGSAYAAVGGAVDADHRAEIAVAAGGQTRLVKGVAATLDASLAHFPVGTVTGLHPGFVIDVGAGQAQVSARWINVWDENGDYRSGYSTTLRWQPVDRLAMRIGYADAPESSDGATVEVSSWNAGVDVGLTDRLLVRLGYLSEDRDAYDREEVSLGLGLRF